MANQFSKKYDGWITAGNSLEKEAHEHTTYNLFCSELFEEKVKKMLKLKKFKTLKQFMVRLYRNNLYLNKNARRWEKDDNDKCWACTKCTE